MSKYRKYILFTANIYILLLLLGCTTPPTVPLSSEGMIVHGVKSMPNTPYTLGVNVTKGEHRIKENFFHQDPVKVAVYDSDRYVDAFKDAIIYSVKNTGIFTTVRGDKETEYFLDAKILSVSYPSVALGLTVLLNIEWTFIKNDSSKVLLKDEIGTAGVTTTEDSWLQVKRIGIGIERASQRNIELMLEKLTKINLQ